MSHDFFFSLNCEIKKEEMDNQRIDKVLDFILSVRKALFISLVVIIVGLFVRSYVNDIKYEVKFLEDNLARVMKSIENTSLLQMKKIGNEQAHIEFKDWSDQQMLMVKGEIQKLRDNVKSVKLHSGIKDEELTRYDLALESSGGRVVSVHQTKLMNDCSPWKVLLGACHRRYPPEKAIQSSNEPGQCFCFKGTEGAFTIRMSCEAILDAVTLEHIPRNLSPTSEISSAPKKFELTGYKNIDDEKGIEYGTFEFDPKVMHKQVYSVSKSSIEKVKYVKMTVLENHGDKTQTCIYRLQLHGFVEKC